jgi:lipid II:glycine glycyltransferase (peptidoglycan interpeptide bridge formation enzyme)
LPLSPVAGNSLCYGARRNSYLIEDLDKKTREELWISLRKTLRPVIEKSQGAGLEVREAKSRQELKKFYNLYIRTCKRNRALAYPYSFFSYFWERPAAEIILARKRDKIIAGSVFLLHKGFVHYFINASDRSYKALYPNHLILWLQIVKYLGREHKFFDLGGTREGSPLEVFKSGWGAKKYPIFELTNRPISEELRHSPLRKIWGLLPSCLIKRLSPYFLQYKV